MRAFRKNDGKFLKTQEKERPRSNTHGLVFVRRNTPEKTVKKLPHDLRFTVMADCIRIGNKAARQMGSQRQRRSSPQLFLTVFSRETNPQLWPATAAK